MRITTNKSDPGPKKQTSDRRYKDSAEANKQAKDEGKKSPFQTALRDAEKRNLKQFHYHDKSKKTSDTPFDGSRPIATRSYGGEERKPTPSPKVLPQADPKVKGQPGGKIDVPKTTITVNKEKPEHGSRTHSVKKNTLLRKIHAAIDPDKYGAVSNHGKSVNVNRSQTYRDAGKSKVKDYTITLGGDKDKKVTVKKLKPKEVIKAAKEKGYIK